MRNNLPVTGHEVILRDDHLIVSKTDLKGRITYVNTDFIEISGFDEGELLGEPHNLVRHPDMPPEAFEDLWNSLNAGRPWVGYVKNRCKNGDYYWVEAHAAPIWENRQVVGYMSVRRKPARDRVDACEKAYREFREGRARGKAIIDGSVLSTSWLARLARRLTQLSLTAKLGIGCAIAAILVMGASSEILGSRMAVKLQERGVADLRQNLALIRGMVEVRAGALKSEAIRLTDLLASYFPGTISLETRDGEPMLKQGAVLLNGRFDEVDRFSAAAKAVATVFARKGDDFLRISTSLKKESGERAVGTLLGREHPAYARIMAGEAFVGNAKLFGKDYYTSYRPIKDPAGTVIGILFVGLDISAELDALKRQIKNVRVGDSGYFFALDAKPGKDQGMALIHPAKEGQVIIGAKDPSGREFIREMIEKKHGEIAYPWTNSAAESARQKFAVFETFEDWGWLIAGGTYLDEFDALANGLKHLLIGVSLIVGLLLVGIIVWLIRRLVYRPLHDQVLPAFWALSAGRYDNRLDTARYDEIGQVMQGLETMQNRLGFENSDAASKADEMARVMSALDYVSTPVRIADPKGVVIYANKSMLDTLRRLEPVLQSQNANFSVETFVGSSIGNLYADPAGALQRLASLASTVQTEMDIGGRTYRVLTSPVLSASGERLGSVGEWQDRTEEIAIEQEVSGIVESAQRGNLSERIAMVGKSGFFNNLSERINGLLDTTHQSLIATSEVLSRVAQGDLTRRIDRDYEGIFGQLKNDTNATVDRLVEVVGRIKDASEAINTAAKEIASGNQDLSSRTEEQASSLQETASSMEEINATVRQNVESARQAEELARNSNELTARGSQMVKNVVATMSAIQGSSKRIADITGVIDGIAFQTNILALNAAVEAARAGEQPA